jgi:hypothetical protein
MEGNPSKKKSKADSAKKYLPYIILLLLTVILMLFFKHHKQEINSMLEEGKKNLISFYTSNLKPLFTQTEISNEDLFNFALYRSLPLDKEKNRVLVLNDDNNGNMEYVIKSAVFNPSTNNYGTFTKYLGLNRTQKEKADSILNSYKKEIYASIFINDKSTIAVNPKINELQQAILADLISFAQKIDRSKTEEIFHQSFSGYDGQKMANLIRSARRNPKDEFILITPDTVARTNFSWNQQNFNNQLEDFEKHKVKESRDFDFKIDLAPEIKGADHALPKNFKFTLDSNMSKVVLPMDVTKITRMIGDSLRVKLNEVAKNLKRISRNMRKNEARGKNSAMLALPGIPLIVNPYDLVSKTFEALSKSDFKGLQKLGEKFDSLARSHNGKGLDSLKQKIRREMESYRRKAGKENYGSETDTSKNE